MNQDPSSKNPEEPYKPQPVPTNTTPPSGSEQVPQNVNLSTNPELQNNYNESIPKGVKKAGKLGLIVIVIIVLAALGSIGYYFSVMNKKTNTYNPNSTTPNNQAISETPVGTTATANNLAVTVLETNRAPAVTGDAPDAGMEYLAVDIRIKNTGSGISQITSGNFLYLLSAGDEIPTASTATNLSEPNGPQPKNVEIQGKTLFRGLEEINSEAEITRTLVYQIPIGDIGKLIWYSNAGPYKENRLAIFRLNK